jgi:uncharacterized protein (TIGR03067 family)
MAATIEGTWIVVSAEMGAEPVKQGSPPVGEQWTFDSGRLVVRGPGLGCEQFDYTLDCSKRPTEIGLRKLTSSEIPPRGWIGIYRVNGDILMICAFPEVGERMPRPSKFETERDDLQVLWRMERLGVTQPAVTTGAMEERPGGAP